MAVLKRGWLGPRTFQSLHDPDGFEPEATVPGLTLALSQDHRPAPVAVPLQHGRDQSRPSCRACSAVSIHYERSKSPCQKIPADDTGSPSRQKAHHCTRPSAMSGRVLLHPPRERFGSPSSVTTISRTARHSRSPSGYEKGLDPQPLSSFYVCVNHAGIWRTIFPIPVPSSMKFMAAVASSSGKVSLMAGWSSCSS